MRTSAEPTGGMRLREVGDGGEELDENDLWDTMDGPDADDVSTSDDDDEDDDDDDVAREDALRARDALPSSVPATYGSFPGWKSSLPRPIIHAAASPSARASAAPPLRDADDVASSLGVPEPPPASCRRTSTRPPTPRTAAPPARGTWTRSSTGNSTTARVASGPS